MKQYKKGIAFGAFDPLHYGHLQLFRHAKEQCDLLVVCVSDGQYIRAHKGHDERVPHAERMRALLRIVDVDEVDEQTIDFGKKEAIARYKPDVIFVGDDWNPNTFGGENLGVPVVYLPHTNGITSTEMDEVKKLHEALDYAIGVIEAYQAEIREAGYDKQGFCQGVMFKNAIDDIQAKGYTP